MSETVYYFFKVTFEDWYLRVDKSGLMDMKGGNK